MSEHATANLGSVLLFFLCSVVTLWLSVTTPPLTLRSIRRGRSAADPGSTFGICGYSTVNSKLSITHSYYVATVLPMLRPV